MVFTVPSGKAFVSQNKGSCIKWHPNTLHSSLHSALACVPKPCCWSTAWITECSQAWVVVVVLGDFWNLFSNFLFPSNLFEPYSVSCPAVWRLRGFLWALLLSWKHGEIVIIEPRGEKTEVENPSLFFLGFCLYRLHPYFRMHSHTNIRKQFIAQGLSKEALQTRAFFKSLVAFTHTILVLMQ